MFDEKQSTNPEKFKRFYCSNDSFHCGPCVWQEEVEEKINNKEGTHDPETDKAQKQRDIADGSAICVCVCVSSQQVHHAGNPKVSTIHDNTLVLLC